MNNSIPLPKIVQLECTNACNLTCKHCYANAGTSEPTEISLSTAQKLISDFKSMGITVISISGGEPLLHSNIFELIRLFKKKFKIIINSNGLLIDSNAIKQFSALKIDYAIISLHGYYPATHDWLTTFSGSYYKAIEALYHLQKAKIRTGISTTIHQKNWQEVHKIMEIASDLGIYDWFVFRFVKIGRAITEIEDIDITPEQHKAVFEKVKQLSSNLGVAVRYYSEAPYIVWGTDEDFSPCKAGREIGVITANGDVLACTGMRLPELICGNIYQQSFRDIWYNSPTLQKLRNFYNNFNEQIQGHCKNCQHLSICHAGCRLLAFLDCGHLTGSDPGCWIQRSSS